MVRVSAPAADVGSMDDVDGSAVGSLLWFRDVVGLSAIGIGLRNVPGHKLTDLHASKSDCDHRWPGGANRQYDFRATENVTMITRISNLYEAVYQTRLPRHVRIGVFFGRLILAEKKGHRVNWAGVAAKMWTKSRRDASTLRFPISASFPQAASTNQMEEWTVNIGGVLSDRLPCRHQQPEALLPSAAHPVLPDSDRFVHPEAVVPALLEFGRLVDFAIAKYGTGGVETQSANVNAISLEIAAQEIIVAEAANRISSAVSMCMREQVFHVHEPHCLEGGFCPASEVHRELALARASFEAAENLLFAMGTSRTLAKMNLRCMESWLARARGLRGSLETRLLREVKLEFNQPDDTLYYSGYTGLSAN